LTFGISSGISLLLGAKKFMPAYRKLAMACSAQNAMQLALHKAEKQFF
jgi:hypothetical protein